MAGERALYVVVCDQVFSRPGSSSHIQKTLKSTEKQESEKRIKMQQEVVEVLETSGKSKKCNPVEAGLYKLKAQKLGSGILYSGHIFPKKLPEKPPTVPIGFDFEMEKRIKQPTPAHISNFRFSQNKLAESAAEFDVDAFWVVVGPAFNADTGDDFFALTLDEKDIPDVNGNRPLTIIYYKK